MAHVPDQIPSLLVGYCPANFAPVLLINDHIYPNVINLNLLITESFCTFFNYIQTK